MIFDLLKLFGSNAKKLKELKTIFSIYLTIEE
jgi:hypothetical protein